MWICWYLESILNYLALISFASKSFSHEQSSSPGQASWIQDFSRLVGSINATSQEITSILALLSAAVTNGNPLPPYLKAPKAYQLSQKLEALDPDILSVTHITEPGYSAFAVIQIASSLVSDDLGKLIEWVSLSQWYIKFKGLIKDCHRNVKELVGEVDFSFHVISTADDSSQEVLLNKEKTS